MYYRRTKILPALALAAFIPMVCSARLSKETNYPRGGDKMTLSTFELPATYMTDSCADFSAVTLFNGGKMHVLTPGDSSVIYITAAGSSVRLHTDGDRLVLMSEGKPGQYVVSRLSEPELYFGEMLHGNFCKSGTNGAETFVGQYGVYDYRTYPDRTLIGCAGEVLSGCTLVEYTTESYLGIGDARDFKEHFDTIAASDIASHIFAADSLSHKQIRRRWFAPGYRYPIVDIRCDTLLSYGTVIDTNSAGLYLSPELQKMELAEDPENERLRFKAYKTMRNDHDNVTQTADDNALTLAAYPAVTTGTTTLIISTEADGRCDIRLTDAAGRVLEALEIETEAGAANRLTLDLGKYPAGNYIATAYTDTGSASVKLVRP